MLRAVFVSKTSILGSLGVMEIAIGSILLVIWIVINGPLILKKEWRFKVFKYNLNNLRPKMIIEDH